MRGRLLLVVRLARRDLRRRWAEACLLLLAIAVTTTTLTIGLAVRGVVDRPWDRTRAATAGPDVTAELSGAPAAGAAVALRALAHAPGVSAAAGPYQEADVQLGVRDFRVHARIQDRDVAAAAVDRPLVTEGTWIRSRAVVVERSYALALRVRPGDRITLGGRPLRVAGIAVSAARAPYPSQGPGLIWVTRLDGWRLASTGTHPGSVLNLRLADPANAPAFVAAHSATGPGPNLGLRSWQDIGVRASAELVLAHEAMTTGSWALAILSVACVVVLVGGRMADQNRRVGLLKAVGATPRMSAVVLLAEHLLLAPAAAAVGLAVGWVAAPTFTRPGTGLVGAANPPALGPGVAATVVFVAVAVAATATVIPAIRGARASTVRALTGRTAPPHRMKRLIALSARMPVPLMLGVRLAARRPRRTLLATLNLAVTVAIVVVALAIRHLVDTKNARLDEVWFVPGAGNPVMDRLNQIVVVFMIALLVLAAVNAVLIAWTTSIDASRPTALARAQGATPGQIARGLSAAQLAPALIAAILGIPLGLLIFAAAAAGSGRGLPMGWLFAVVPGTLIAVAVLTAVPLRIGAGRPVAEVLRAD